MFWNKNKKEEKKATVAWNPLESLSQLETIKTESADKSVAIFKHSTRCSISSTALGRFEREWDSELPVKAYYLDLLEHRDISNTIADEFGVVHQSPQLILIKDGKAVYNASHLSISVEELKAKL